MNDIFAPINIIKKIKELNKNCIVILGDEPVVSNHIKKEIRSFTNSNNIESYFEYLWIIVEPSFARL